MTKLAVDGVSGVRENFLTLILGAIGMFVAVGLLRRISRVKYWLDAAQARAPIIGGFTVTGELARFSRTISMLLEAGLPLSSAIATGSELL